MPASNAVRNSEAEFGLSLEELAVLEFTNGEYELQNCFEGRPDPSGRALLTLTTKEVYIWAVVLADIATKNPNLTVEELAKGIHESVDLMHWQIKDQVFASIPNPMSGPAPGAMFGMALLQIVLGKFGLLPVPEAENTEKHVAPYDERVLAQIMFHQFGVFKRARDAMESLVEKGLIEDPVEIEIAASVGLAVLGFVPVGFTKKTNNGITVYRRISAGYWTYEMSKKNGVKTENFTFRFLGLIRAFKRALIEEFGKHQ